MWVALALIAALAHAGRQGLMKGAMRSTDEVRLGVGVGAVGFVLLLIPLFLDGLPTFESDFWWALAGSGSINAFVAVAMARAVDRSDLSVVSPLLATTPIFLLGTGFLILGEAPTATGIAGVIVIALGAYLLRGGERRTGGWLAPLRALLRDEGARWMLGVAFLFSISAALDKVGVLASSPLAWAAALNGFVAASLLPFALLRPVNPEDAEEGGLRRALPLVLLAGLAAALTLGTQMTALREAPAAYVIAVKRTSVLWGVLFGAPFFREERISERLLGAAVMLGGFILVTLS